MSAEGSLVTRPIDVESQAVTERAPGLARLGNILVVVTVAIAIIAGALLRSWYLFHVPSTSDQAIVGLMANAILHGHFSAFYWGQAYGGVEPYAAAAMFALFGHSVFVLDLTPVLLSGAAALLTWRAALRLLRFRTLAAVVGALVWVAPDAAIANSTQELGFRSVTMICGLACVLCALRLLDGSYGFVDVIALGLFVGLGWWSSPEVIYFLLPAALLVLGAVLGGGLDLRRWITRLTAGAGAFVVGALPWLWANVNSGFSSLKSSSFPAGTLTSLNTGYWGRMSVFLHFSVPTELNLRRLGTGSFLFGASGSGVRHAFGVSVTILLCVVLALAVVLCASRGGRWLAMAAAVVAFPFLFAAQPGTWYWTDGRYIVFLGPLLALAAVPGLEEAFFRFPRRSGPNRRAKTFVALSAALVAAMVLSLFVLAGDNQTSVSRLAFGWGEPNAPVDRAISTLQANGVRSGFADYWVAYKVDFLSGQSLTFTPAKGDVDRQPALARAVALSKQQAWLFVPPSQMTLAFAQFDSDIPGPDGITESRFLTALGILHVHYREVDAGVVSAVVPSRHITIDEVAAVPAGT